MSNIKHFITKAALLGLLSMAFGLSALAQISLSVQNKPIRDIMKEIEKQSDYRFFYSNDYPALTMQKSINVKDEKIEKVLDQLTLHTNLAYILKADKQIVLTEKGNVSQQKKNKVTGIVKDADGEPIIGANVMVKGQSIGTITDIDGRFVLDAPANAVLQITYIGYVADEVKVSGKKELTIILKEDTETLDEVVVVGYGTMKKRDITGAVSSVNTSVLTAGSAPSAADALQGRIAGVNIQKNAGRPGGSYSIQVRGVSSIKNKNSGPLYVIDGIPTSEGMNDLNPNDIETIDVLKDASATAIYGSRGANGVVIITTRRGEKGKVSIQYEGNVGFREASHLPDMMNGDDYVQFRTDLYRQLGRSTDRSNAEFFTAEE